MCVKRAAQLRQVLPQGHLQSRGLMVMLSSSQNGFYLSIMFFGKSIIYKIEKLVKIIQYIIISYKIVILTIPDYILALLRSCHCKSRQIQLIIIMWINKKDQMEQCFVDQENQQYLLRREDDLKIEIHRNIKEHLPANELRTVRRPESMRPRTLFLDRPLYLLSPQINSPCYQTVQPTESGKLKLKIVNSKNLTLQQYFTKKKFVCVYDKLQTNRLDNKTFISKLKGIDSLIDYNWKNFKQLQQQAVLHEQPKQDKIDSDFQSGNLCKAFISVQQENQFYLLIENDVNTYGYNNWFFFRIKNKGRGIKRFTLVNMIKKTSFFSQGMLISIFSNKKNQAESSRWFKGGSKITFSSINFIRDHHAGDYYSCLSFEYNFQFQDDEVYFALNQPYTYSRLINFVQEVKQTKEINVDVKNIGYSISNNIIPSVKFSHPKNKSNDIILILARQHPCETTGSFIAEAIMKELTNYQNPFVDYLLQQFEVILVPMVNPDGVIHGMSRCNVSGLDLNRQWGQNIIKELTPQTVKIKQFIMSISKTKNIKYMIDLHGHGKKLNSFFFSCKRNENENYKLLSMSMKKIENRFNIYGCTYGITKDKQNTIRSKINSMGISHSYTLETSLYGWKNENNEVKHFNEDDFSRIAISLIKSIYLIEASPLETMKHLSLTKEILIKEMSSMIDIIEKDDKINMDNNEILSDSDPEGDRFDVNQLLKKCINKSIKRKLEESYEKSKKMKFKRSKNSCKTEESKLNNKNIAQSLKNLQSFQKIAPLTNQSQLSNKSSLKGEPVGLNKKNLTVQKWKWKRQIILQKKKLEELHKISYDDFNISKSTLRNRLKSQMSTVKQKKINTTSSTLFQNKIVYPKKMVNKKVKTQFQQIEQYCFLGEQIKQDEKRKSALQLKFKQLKQQSLDTMLTDTLSILKILPNQRASAPTQYQSKHSKTTASIAQKPNQYLIQASNGPKVYTDIGLKQANEGSENQSLRYKKFRQFINNGSSNKKVERKNNSVFYYFPIL